MIPDGALGLIGMLIALPSQASVLQAAVILYKVNENWRGESPVLIGKLYVSSVRGKEQPAFEYDTWIL